MKSHLKAPLSILRLTLATLACAATLQACAPLVVGGAAVGGALMATDRRTSGTQVEDASIEVKGGNRVKEVLGDRGHVNVNSYNRMVLLTGEVPNEADRTAVEQAVARVENVKSVVNELAVGFSSSLSSRSNDVLIQSKVKATFLDAKDLMSNAFDVVVERGNVYLMGRVTEREANRATDLTRSISGVVKVVRVFEVITEAELAELPETTKPQPVKPASSPQP